MKTIFLSSFSECMSAPDPARTISVSSPPQTVQPSSSEGYRNAMGCEGEKYRSSMRSSRVCMYNLLTRIVLRFRHPIWRYYRNFARFSSFQYYSIFCVHLTLLFTYPRYSGSGFVGHSLSLLDWQHLPSSVPQRGVPAMLFIKSGHVLIFFSFSQTIVGFDHFQPLLAKAPSFSGWEDLVSFWVKSHSSLEVRISSVSSQVFVLGLKRI